MPTRLIGGLALGAAGVAIAVKLLSPRPNHVPFGIGGFQLGAPVDTSRAERAVVEPPSESSRRPQRFTASALVFDEPAQCVLEATSTGQLVHVACTLSSAADPDEAARRQRRVLATLRQLYGKESSERPAGEWEWRNSRAYLRLTAAQAPGEQLRVLNGWAGSDSVR